jgi:hypothetical protein
MITFFRYQLRPVILAIALFSSLYSMAQSHYGGQHSGKILVKDAIPAKAYAFDLQDVKLLPVLFKKLKYVLSNK